ncbi:MAG TPA: hypothetical protein VMT57_07735 [Candidatus Thermoplasmatota archaeon]|nr:hypothetical protein [Candidatus Thermoplasmatota archaeon]
MTPNSQKKLLQAGNILAMIITIIVNGLAIILPLNGKTTQELSDALPNLFVPANLTFSIWGIIYILWVVFAIYQARDVFRKEKVQMPFLFQISWLFILSGVFNSAWIFAWQYQQVGLSLIIMIALLLTLIALYVRLEVGRSSAPLKEKLCVHLPFSVYLGWITVATIANVTAYLVSVHWDGLGISAVMWTQLVIGVGVLITVLALILRRDIAYSLVVVWALLGIYLKRSAQESLNSDVATTALIAMVIVLIGIIAAAVWLALKRGKKPAPA